MATSRSGPSGTLLALGVFVLAWALYANAIPNGFAFDDLPLIVQNRMVASLDQVPELFASDFWAPYGGSGLYRPVVTTSYALERAAFGTDPAGFHAVNVGLHATVSMLALLVVAHLTRDRWVAGATALLFAAHAVHTEVVASVSTGRPELLAALFALAALQLHLLANEAEEGRRTILRALGLACYALALLSKESAFTLLGVVLLVDWIRPEARGPVSLRALGETLRTRWRIHLPWLAVTAAVFALRYAVLGTLTSERTPGFVDNPLAHVSTLWRLVNATAIAFRYVALFLLPLDLSHDYSYDQVPLILTLDDPRLLGVGLLTIGALALGVWCARHSRSGFLAFGLFAVTFSVGSNLVIPVTAIMAERLLYLPSLGLCFGLALALRAVAELLPLSDAGRRASFAVTMAVLIAFNGGRTLLRNPDWRSNQTIRLHDVARHPRNAKLQTNAGYSQLEHGNPEAALDHFEAAIEIVGSPERWAEPFRGKVWALIGVGRLDDARALHRRVRSYVHDPYIQRALAGRARLPSAPEHPAPPR